MQIPILSGIYTNKEADFRTSYPRNMVPIAKEQGISAGYLRPADGIVKFNEIPLPGADRGAINWDNICYRVMGSSLISVSREGNATILGDIGGNGGQIVLDYSFDFLAVVANNNLYYLSPNGDFQQVISPFLGKVIDIVWVDGYFVLTDGEFLIFTELNDPTVIDPTKYVSSEVDPDPILSLHKLFNEVYAVNRYTIEVFVNIGGEGVPFQKVKGAQITRGAVGTHATAVFEDTIAFVGGGRKEAISVWLGVQGQSIQIATREVDKILKNYSERQLSESVLEEKIDDGHQHLYLHLPDQTIVYDAAASKVLGQSVWFILTSGLLDLGAYPARNFVWCYDRWITGDPNEARIGFMSDEVSTYYGEVASWEFSTSIIYNEGRGAIFHELELVGLTGRAEFKDNPFIDTQYSLDGEVWSQRKFIRVGGRGARLQRLVWLSQGDMRNWRIQRFRGTTDARLSLARLQARITPLEV